MAPVLQRHSLLALAECPKPRREVAERRAALRRARLASSGILSTTATRPAQLSTYRHRATMAVYIASGKRTAFGAFGGALKSHTASQVRQLSPAAVLRHARGHWGVQDGLRSIGSPPARPNPSLERAWLTHPHPPLAPTAWRLRGQGGARRAPRGHQGRLCHLRVRPCPHACSPRKATLTSPPSPPPPSPRPDRRDCSTAKFSTRTRRPPTSRGMSATSRASPTTSPP